MPGGECTGDNKLAGGLMLAVAEIRSQTQLIAMGERRNADGTMVAQNATHETASTGDTESANGTESTNGGSSARENR